MGFISKKGNIVLMIGLIILCGSIAGVFYVMVEKEAYLFDSETGGLGTFEYSQTLEGDHSYEVTIGVYHREISYDAVVEADVEIYVDGILVLEDTLYYYDTLEEDDSYSEAYAATTYTFSPAEEANLTIVGDLISGDDWSITLYQDVPPTIGTHFLIAVGIAIVGVVIMIIGIFLRKREEE